MSSLNHEQKPKLDDIVLENDILCNTASGLDADDRAGVYALLGDLSTIILCLITKSHVEYL